MGRQSNPPRLLSPTAMGDMEKAVCMTDHFDKIQKLPDPIPGVPNFRRVPGFKVYCCGQPTLDGFEKVLEKVTGSIYPKDVALPSSGKCSIPAKELTIGKSFVDFMGENSSLRAMVDTGKGNLQWERDIPPAALSNLENLAKSNFKGNLGQIIHDIYQTAHQMFSDMPQGDHKKRAKYRFASKTLMRILPA